MENKPSKSAGKTDGSVSETLIANHSYKEKNLVFFWISSQNNQISQTKQRRENQQQRLHSGARSASNTCSASFPDVIHALSKSHMTRTKRRCWDACMKLTFDLHRTSSKRIKPTYTTPSSGSNRQERLVPQSWGRDSHGCCLSWLLPKMLQLQSNILDHFSIEAMPCYAHSTSHGILQHLMIVCKSAGQTCLGRAESCDLCAGRVERGRSNLAAMRILRQVRQDPFQTCRYFLSFSRA